MPELRCLLSSDLRALIVAGVLAVACGCCAIAAALVVVARGGRL